MAIGNGKILENGKVRPMDLKVGDRVPFGKFSGTEVKVAGEELIVAREEDIMAVIDEPPTERKSSGGGRASGEKGPAHASDFAGHGPRVLGAVGAALQQVGWSEPGVVAGLSGGTRISNNGRRMSPGSTPCLSDRAQSGSSVARRGGLEGASP